MKVTDFVHERFVT